MPFFIALLLSVTAQASLPQSRMEDLQSRCPKLMESAAQQQGIEDAEFSERYRIDVDGFTLQGNRSQRVYRRVETQAREAARFVAWLYRQLPVSRELFFPFQFIEIVPHPFFSWQRSMELEGDTLVLRMGRHVLTAEELRQRWQAGKQFGWHSPQRTVWRYANPAGTIVQALKKSLIGAQSIYAGQLRSLLERHRADPAALRTALHQWIGDTTGSDLAEDLARQVEITEDAALVSKMDDLSQTLSDPSTAVDFVSQLRFDALAAKPDEREGTEIYIRVIASIYGVGNFHWIRVTAGYGPTAMSLVTSTLPAFKKLNVWIVMSFIGVYTVDVVDVSAFAEKLYLASAVEAAFHTDSATKQP